MPIKPNAAPDEVESDFYIANERICKEFEAFFEELGGETKGAYNAFSYNAIARVKHPLKWTFQIKKSTYAATSIWLNSNYQGLLVACLWKAHDLRSDCPGFYIRKGKFFDFIKINLSKNWYWFDRQGKYVMNTSEPNHALIKQVKEFTKDLLNSKKVWEINYSFSDTQLSIDLRSDMLHLNTIKRLLDESATWS